MKTTYKQTIRLSHGPIKCLCSYKSQTDLKRDKYHLCIISNEENKTKFSKGTYNEQFVQQ